MNKKGKKKVKAPTPTLQRTLAHYYDLFGTTSSVLVSSQNGSNRKAPTIYLKPFFYHRGEKKSDGSDNLVKTVCKRTPTK
jgi:hypothetical protein